MMRPFNGGRLNLQLSQIEALKCTPPRDPRFVQALMFSGAVHELEVPEDTNAVDYAAQLVVEINNSQRSGGDAYTVVQKAGR